MSDSVTPWTVVYQAPLSIGFPRQEYWSELPFPSPGDLPNPGIKTGSPGLQADSLPTEPPGKPWKEGGIKYLSQISNKNILYNTRKCSHYFVGIIL